MRVPASEKFEIIRLVEQSHLPVRRTLEMIGVPWVNDTFVGVWDLRPDYPGFGLKAFQFLDNLLSASSQSAGNSASVAAAAAPPGISASNITQVGGSGNLPPFGPRYVTSGPALCTDLTMFRTVGAKPNLGTPLIPFDYSGASRSQASPSGALN